MSPSTTEKIKKTPLSPTEQLHVAFCKVRKDIDLCFVSFGLYIISLDCAQFSALHVRSFLRGWNINFKIFQKNKKAHFTISSNDFAKSSNRFNLLSVNLHYPKNAYRNLLKYQKTAISTVRPPEN